MHMGSVTSLSVQKVRRSNSPRDWTLRDMLLELVRRIEENEMAADLPTVVVIESPTGSGRVNITTLAAGVDSTDDAIAMMARGIRAL